MQNAQSRTFSERLQYAMDMKGLNAFALSKELQTAHSTVGRWLQANGFMPRAQLVKKLATILSINAQWLLYGEGPMRPGDPAEAGPSEDFGPMKPVELRQIPVISWAHAGQATSYEELPKDWQRTIPSTSKSKKAFGLIVEGDSMEQRCFAGDIVSIDPDKELGNGCLVVAKLRDDGVVLRRYSKLEGGRIKLIPYNTLYPSVDYAPKDFNWIYRVVSTLRQE